MASSTSKDAKMSRKDQLEKWKKTTTLMELDADGIEEFIEALIKPQDGPEDHRGDLIRKMKNPAKDVEFLKKCLNSSTKYKLDDKDQKAALISNAENVSDYFIKLWECEKIEIENLITNFHTHCDRKLKEACQGPPEIYRKDQLNKWIETRKLEKLDEAGIKEFINYYRNIDVFEVEDHIKDEDQDHRGDLIRKIKNGPAKDVEFLEKCLESPIEMKDVNKKALISKAEKVSDYFTVLWEREEPDLIKKFDSFKEHCQKELKKA